MDYKKYFKQEKKSLIFIGDTLDIYIPLRYESHGYLEIANTVRTIGVFDMTINGNIETGYLLAALIEICPSEMSVMSIQNDKFVKLTLFKNDIFIRDTTIVNDSKISYILFYEIFYSGHFPNFIDYNGCGTLYDNVAKATGDKFRTDHMIFEMIASAIFRDKNNPGIYYRNTSRKELPLAIPLRTIAYITQSTTAKIMGSYMREGVDVSLVNEADSPSSDIEDILRV